MSLAGMKELQTETQVAEHLGVSLSTLRKWRGDGRFCKEIRLPNGAVRFFTADIDRWVAARAS